MVFPEAMLDQAAIGKIQAEYGHKRAFCKAVDALKEEYFATRQTESVPAISASSRGDRRPVTILSPASFEHGPILWVHERLCCGGIERQLSITAQEVRKRGLDDVRLLCTSLEAKFGNDFFLPSVRAALGRIYLANELPANVINELLPLALRHLGHIDWLNQDELSELMLFTLWMLHVRPRCVHVWQGDHPREALAACLAGVPRVILSGRSLSPRRRTPLGLEGPDVEKTYRTYAALREYPAFAMTNNSRAGREDYADWLDYPVEKIAIFTNAMPVPSIAAEDRAKLRTKLGLGPDAKIIGGAFRFSAIKNPQLWLAAAQRTLEQVENAVAVLWGEGPLLSECRAWVERSGCSGRILLPGKAADGMLALSISDVVLLTSIIEGLPNIVLEAQSLGIPVVTTQAGGTADAFAPGRSGWLVTRRTPEALAERLVFVLRDSEWAAQAKQHALAHITQNFTVERTMNSLLACYNDLPLQEAAV
jgi:glycosyltransferase involved in cell wall biosynthesis